MRCYFAGTPTAPPCGPGHYRHPDYWTTPVNRDGTRHLDVCGAHARWYADMPPDYPAPIDSPAIFAVVTPEGEEPGP